MKIRLSLDKKPTSEPVIELYESSGLHRPTNDKIRIQKMLKNSNIIITAWDGDVLVGIARTITD